VLPANESRQLLNELIGARALSEPDSTATMADYCCGLPLALRIAAEYAIARPASELAELVAELADQRRRLDVLDARADRDTAIRAVFSWSYRALPPDTARAFRLVGLHPGRDLDGHAIAALVGDTVDEAARLVGQLLRAFLIRRTGPDRYAMHDLLRAYAAEQATADTDREPALVRLYAQYLHTAGVATAVAYPADAAQRPAIAPIGGPVSAFDSVGDALTWLDTVRDNLVAVAVDASAHGRPHYTTGLSLTLGRYLYVGSHYAEGLLLHGHAHDVAVAMCDRAAAAGALRYLGITHDHLTHHADAIDHFRRSLAICRELDDQWGQGNILTNLANVEVRQGNYDDARRTCLAALALHRATGNRLGEGITLNNLGYICTSLGRYQEALDHLRTSLDVRRAAGEESGGTCTLSNLGSLHARLGQYTEALGYQRQSLDLHRTRHDRVGEGASLSSLGETYLRADRHDEALDHLRQALEISGETGERSLEARTLNTFAETLRAVGQADAALRRYESALTVATDIGDGAEQARAERGIGHLHHDAGQRPSARAHWERALAGYAELGMPDADELRELLLALGRAEVSKGDTR
jgi:tetratricopeptide (TPR) repeat protein